MSAIKKLKKAGDITSVLNVLTTAFPNLSGVISSFVSSLMSGTATIGTFKTAISGLWTVLTAHPIAAVIAAVGALVVGFNAYNQSVQEAVNKAKEAGTAWSESNTSIQSQIDKIEELRTALDNGTLSEEESYQAKEELLSIQQSLSESYGQQVAGIDLVNGSLKEQIGLLREASQAEADKFLNENRKGIAEAEKAMSANLDNDWNPFTESYNLGYFDNGTEGERILRNAVQKYGDLFELVGDGATTTIYFKGNATEAEETLNQVMTEVRNASEHIADDPLVTNFLNNASTALIEADTILTEYQDLYNQAQEARLVADQTEFKASDYSDEDGQTAIEWLNDYAEAVQNYNDAIASGDTAKITKAKNEFGLVHAAIQELLQNSDFAEYSDQFNAVFEQLNQGAINLNDFKKSLSGTSDYGIFEGVAESAKELQNLDLTDFDLRYALDTDGTQEGEQALNRLVGAAKEAGIISDDSASSVQTLIDMLVEAGIISQTVAESTEEVAESTTDTVDTLSTSLENAIARQDNLNAAMASSVSASGLTSEEILNVANAYKDLDGYNPDKLFERTANGIHINAAELRKLDAELKKNEMADYQQQIIDKQQELNQARLQGADTSVLESELSMLQQMAAQYDGLTSAYQRWLDAQSGGEEGDMYRSVHDTMLERGKELYESQLYNNKEFRAIADFYSNKDLTNASAEEVKAAYEEALPAIERYFTESREGVDNFVRDMMKLSDAEGLNWYETLEDGSIRFNTGNDEQIAEMLGIDVEAVQSIYRMMSEYRDDILIGDTSGMNAFTSQVEDAQSKIQQLQDAGELSSSISVDYDVNDMSLEDMQTKISELKEERVEINAETNPEAAEALDELISKTEKAYFFKLNADTSGGLDQATSAVESIQQRIAVLQAEKPVMSISAIIEGDEEIQSLAAQLATLPPEVQTTIGISTENVGNVDGIISQLSQNPESINVPVNYTKGTEPETVEDASGIANYTLGESPAEVPDAWGDANFRLGTYPTSIPSITQTVNQVLNPLQLATGTMLSAAHADGTAYNVLNLKPAYANGKVALSQNEEALVNELGTESVIRDGRWFMIPGGMHVQSLKKGDIVLSAQQTKDLLNSGKATGHGKAYAYGTAYNGMSAYSDGGWDFSDSSTSTTTTTTTTSTSTKNTSSKNTTAKAKKDGQDLVDWIERKIEKVQRKIQKFQTVADNIYKSFKTRNTALKNQISSVSDEIDIQKKAYDRYLAQADAVNLKSSLKKKVRNGTIDIDSYGEKTREKIEEYQKWLDKARDCKQAIDDLNVSLSELYNQQFENIITKWEGKLQDLQHEAERTESLISRRTEYASEYLAPENAKEASEANITDYQSLISNAQSQIEKRASELVELRKKLNETLSDPESGIVEGSEGHKNMLAEIQSVESEIDGLNSDIIGYSNSISEEYMNMFDGVAQGYENKLAQAEHLANEYNHALEMAEAKGYQTSAQYYEMLRGIEEENVSLLKEEYDSLMNSMSTALSSGEIEEGSQAYYDMTEQINGVAEAIQEAELNIVEFNNSIRETQWEQFDYLQDRITKVSDEIEFMNELMSNSDMFTDKGKFTDTGMATLGMYGMNYNTLMRQADDYAEEIKKINEEIADDPANTKLIERKDELLEKQRELILAAESEKQAIKDLVSDGIQAEIDSLKELADSYIAALESQKDLYDFQKKVAEQTKNIAALEKQLQAYQNDTTEEARAKIQKISVELADAKSDLEETQYEHYISETKKILDDMTVEYEKVLNERLDNLDMLIEEMIATANSNAVSIDATLREVADSVGYTMSEQMTSTWTNVASQMAIDAAQRVNDTNRLVNQLVSNGAISQQNAASIISALANGDAQALQNTVSIVNGLLANGQLSSENATAILTSMSNGDQLAIANALNIITKLTENGTLAQADAASIVSGLVVGDELSKLHATQTITKLSENGQLSKENATALSTALSTCTGEGSVLATYSKDFGTKLTSLNTTLDGIKTYTDSLQKKAADEAATAKAKAEAEAAAKAAAEKAAAEAAAKAASTKAAAEAATKNTVTETAKKEAEKTTTTATQTKTEPKQAEPKKKSTSTQGDGKLQVGDKVKFNSGKYYENSYGQGNSGYQKRGSQVYVTKINKSGTHPYHISTGKKLGSGDLGWLKKSQISGYASGAKRISQDGLAWINENWDKNGGETYLRKSDKAVLTTVGTDDRIYNAMASENLWKAANSPGQFVMDNLSSARSAMNNQPSETMQKYLSVTENSGNTTIGDINIEMDLSGIADYEEFMQKMQNDKKFAKLIQSISLGAMLGRNPQDKYKIKW